MVFCLMHIMMSIWVGYMLLADLMMYANKVERNKESHDSRELISGNTKCFLSHMKQKYESE